MPQREQASVMSVKSSITPRNTTANVDGSAVDVTDADAQTIVFDFGANIDADATISIQEDDGAGGWIDLGPVQTPALNTLLYGQNYPTPPIANTSYRYAYVGSASTIRARLLTTDASTDISVYVIGNMLYDRPNVSGFTE